MRPDIGDLIEGIKRALSEEILPTINDTFAREQLAYSLFLCEHLANRWDQAHIYFHHEHADLHATLSAVVEIGRRCTTPTARFSALLDSTAVALAADESTTPRPLRAQSAASHALKEMVGQFLDVCGSAAATDNEVFGEIRATLHAWMKRQLARDEEWVTGAQIGWW
jgi:hypothetical protein